jgi:hypothetical protein
MKIIIPLCIFFSLFIFGCKPGDDELSICSNPCQDEIITDILNDIPAKVIINNTYKNDEGKELPVYALTINPDDLEKDTWSLNPEYILAPCNLQARYRKENLQVIISGNRKSCCNILTQPHFRWAYGCKFEITNIKTK